MLPLRKYSYNQHHQLSESNTITIDPPDSIQDETMTALTYSTVVLDFEISPSALSKLKKAFHIVHYHPDGHVPASSWKEADVCFSRPDGLPDGLKLEEVPNLRLVQILSGKFLNLMRRESCRTYSAQSAAC